MFTVRMSDGTEFGPADLDTIVQWCREGRIPRDALLYPTEGGEPKSVFAESRLAALLAAPPTMPTSTISPQPGSKSFFWLPTGNQPALWGYYISVAGLIPPLFVVLSPVSLILGAVGVIRAFTKPASKGLLHALTAILLSLGSPVLWYTAWLYMEQF